MVYRVRQGDARQLPVPLLILNGVRETEQSHLAGDTGHQEANEDGESD